MMDRTAIQTRLKNVRLLFAALLFLGASLLQAGSIIYPWNATTALVKAGESFEVWFDADNGQTVNFVELRGPYNTVSIPESDVNSMAGNWVYDLVSGSAYDTRMTVTVPESAPADRYDLILRTSGQDEESLAAVKVVKEFKSDYFIMHISDTHTYQSGNDAAPYKVSAIADIANIIDPEILFVTGDNMYNVNDANVDKYLNGIPAEGVKGIHGFHAATFMTAGNHDAPGNNADGKDPVEVANQWNQYFGLHTYHFSYGGGRFIMFNNAWSNKRSQEDADHIAWLNEAGMGTIRVSGCHKVLEPNIIQDLQSAANLDAMLGGHNHHMGTVNPHLVNDKPVAYVANSLREYFQFNLFMIDGVQGTITPLGAINADETTPGFGLPTGLLEATENPGDHEDPSRYRPNLTLTFVNPNGGTSEENTATLVNKFDFEIPDARVRFVMLKDRYTVTGGAVEQVIENDTVSVYDVNVDIMAGSTAEVDISRDETRVNRYSLRKDIPIRVQYASDGIQVLFPLMHMSRVSAGLYGLNGELVLSIPEQQLNAGNQTVQLPLDGQRAVTGGVYFIKLEINDEHSFVPVSKLIRILIP